jgi:hypothetical protein
MEHENRDQALVPVIDADIQADLNILMDVMEENQTKIPEGEYLRGMNALGSLHRHTRTKLSARRLGFAGGAGGAGASLQCWLTLEEIEETDEDLYDDIMEVAEDIVVELCGEESSLFSEEDINLVHRGDERDVFRALVNYKPVEGNAGYETNPMVLHHAIQVIMERLFDDTIYELDIVRPVSCQCGWRGTQGNWERHLSNARHLRWVNTERERRTAEELCDARLRVVARREPGIIYIDEMHSTPAVRTAIAEVVAAAELAGDRVVFVNAHGNMSWFAA